MTADPGTVHVGSMRLELHLPGATNLKGKRALLNKTKAALRKELECSVAEVGFQDLWQRAALGIAVAASSATGVDRVLDRAIAVVERDPRVIVTSAVSEASSLDADVSDLPDGSPRGTSW